MQHLTEFFNSLPDLWGVFALMLSTFLIGYFAAFSQQKAKYGKLLKKLQRSDVLSKASPKEKDIDVIFTEIKPKIMEVVKEAQEELIKETDLPKYAKPAEDIVNNTRTSYVTYTKNKPKLNFENFGTASEAESEDLTQINGIGPYIEQKLNEIGIYNYSQIRRLKDEDIRVLTELIDFFPGRIERDNWVEQADHLHH